MKALKTIGNILKALFWDFWNPIRLLGVWPLDILLLSLFVWPLTLATAWRLIHYIGWNNPAPHFWWLGLWNGPLPYIPMEAGSFRAEVWGGLAGILTAVWIGVSVSLWKKPFNGVLKSIWYMLWGVLVILGFSCF